MPLSFAPPKTQAVFEEAFAEPKTVKPAASERDPSIPLAAQMRILSKRGPFHAFVAWDIPSHAVKRSCLCVIRIESGLEPENRVPVHVLGGSSEWLWQPQYRGQGRRSGR